MRMSRRDLLWQARVIRDCAEAFAERIEPRPGTHDWYVAEDISSVASLLEDIALGERIRVVDDSEIPKQKEKWRSTR